MTQKLDDDAIAAALHDTPLWKREGDAITRNFRFKKTDDMDGFRRAMEFMNAVARIATEMDHHPEWCNTYNRVEIRLTTHSCGGLSRLDFDMAMRIDALVAAGFTE